MKLTCCLSSLLLVMAVCLWGIQGVQSQAVETEVEQMSKEVSAAEDPQDVENTKHQLRRAVELAVLKRIKLRNNKVKVRKLPKVVRTPKLKSAPKPRNWMSRLKTGGKYVAGIVAPVLIAEGFTHLYGHFASRNIPQEPKPAPTTDAEELQEALPMHYPQLAPFIMNPAYAQNTAMSYPYFPKPQAVYQPTHGFPNPGYPIQGQSPGYHQGYQNQGFPTHVQKPYLETPDYQAPPEVQPQPKDDSEEASAEESKEASSSEESQEQD